MILSYSHKSLCNEDPNRLHTGKCPLIGILLGRFPGRYTRPKTGIFSRSQYGTLRTLKVCIKAYRRYGAPLLPRLPYIATRPAHVHARRNFPKKFAKFSQVAPHSPAEFAPSRRNPQNPPKLLLCSKLLFMSKNTVMLPLEEFFPKNFSKKKLGPPISRTSHLSLRSRSILPPAEIFPIFFPKKIFPKFLGPRVLASKMRNNLHREKFFAKIFSKFFWDFIQSNFDPAS